MFVFRFLDFCLLGARLTLTQVAHAHPPAPLVKTSEKRRSLPTLTYDYMCTTLAQYT